MKLVLLSLLFGLIVSVSPVASQTALQESTPSARDSGLVRLQFLVLDGHNHPATIAPAGIAIIDRNRLAKSITSLQIGSGVPLRLGLLIDTSRSTANSDLFDDAVDKSIQFVRMALMNPQDKAFVLKFSQSPQATGFMDREQFLRFKMKVKPEDGTALYDSIVLACTERMINISASEPAHLVLVVLSDGEDNASHFSLDRTTAAAQQAGVTIFTISTKQSGTTPRGERALRELAEGTGGESFIPSRGELAEIFRKIQQEVENTYIAIYKPAADKTDNSFHSVEVRIYDKKLHARAPKGYFSRITPRP